jgi:hypothetical protein
MGHHREPATVSLPGLAAAQAVVADRRAAKRRVGWRVQMPKFDFEPDVGRAATFVIAARPEDESLDVEVVSETEGLDVVLAEEVRKSDLPIEEEMPVAALQAFEGGLVDGDGHRPGEDLFRLLTGFDDGLDVISREKIDARLLDHLGPVVHLGGDRFEQRGTSANVSNRESGFGRHGVTGLVGWLNMEKNLSPSAIVLWD